MIFNDTEAVNLGGGVILFPNAIEMDWLDIVSRTSSFIEEEWNDMYKPGIDPETGKDILINKSGYFFNEESVSQMPRRASATHRKMDPEVISILSFMESSKDKYLLKYLEIFPLAYKCVWWKVKGHFLEYKKNVYLGSHSDISADYVYGIVEPTDQLALRNVITCLVYLNDSLDEKDGDIENSYVGGEHYFNYLDINYKPKKGDILFFPSNYMAAHEVKPVIKGVRYSYLGWYSQGTPNHAVNESVTDPIIDPQSAAHDTNVYMPNLAKDFREYLISKGYDEFSDKFQITKSNY